jgi:pyruvate dehydrogenase (quinone)
LKAAVTEAFAIDGPAIVDAVVVSNELPNLPHLDLDMIATSLWQNSGKPFSP